MKAFNFFFFDQFFQYFLKMTVGPFLVSSYIDDLIITIRRIGDLCIFFYRI